MEESCSECRLKNQEITRFTSCPCFVQRKYSLGGDIICWFCQYAHYDLEKNTLPEKGVCCYPKKQPL
ncbi:MAG: hypothetical protein IKU72_01130 [Oscillospiraceae bacterium]|nr:hypothetical protein [Oscillospiraceae bacterium]